MKKTTKKAASKPRGKKATKNLEVKPAKGATVRGGAPKETVTFEYGGLVVKYGAR